MPATARFFELILIPLTEKPRTRKELTDPLKVQEAISYLNRFCARFRWLVVGLLLVSLYKGTAPTTQAGENNDVKVLLRLEGEIAQAWVQRDTQTLEQILADDFTLAGRGDSLIGKSQYIAGLDNPEFRTTSAIIEDDQSTGRAWRWPGGHDVRKTRLAKGALRGDLPSIDAAH